MLGPVREALQRIEANDPRELRYAYDGVYPVSVLYNVPSASGERGRPVDPCINFTFRIQKWDRYAKLTSKKDKVEYWDKSKRKLQRDSLVCFLRKDSKGIWKPVRFGIITNRNSEDLAHKDGKKECPLIGITFFRRSDLEETIIEMKDKFAGIQTKMVVASGSYFAYEPVLSLLQTLRSVPFKEELALGKPSRQLDCIGAGTADTADQPHAHAHSQVNDALDRTPDLKKKVDGFDKAQRAAYDYALQNRVALVQGPPGTGKTYLGVALAETILAASPKTTILCVCYTNHALDSFLEDLLDAGITKLVRIGGMSKSERVQAYRIRELARNGTRHSQSQGRRYGLLKDKIEDAEKQIHFLQKKCSFKIGPKWWESVSQHLEDTDRAAYKQLEIGASVDKEGFGKVIAVDHLWKRWLAGDSPGTHFKERAGQPLWQLSKEQRQQQKEEWENDMFCEEREDLVDHMRGVREARKEINQINDEKYLDVMRKAQIIGCTTTGAAKYQHLLQSVRTEVVLIEEAAEILEAHVITSLGMDCKHLIMIGDHKQLRPKAEHYPLTVESGKGCDLNCSLFERLTSTVEICTLTKQWRMHPDIAAIPKLVTYPELENAKPAGGRAAGGTMHFPDVAGLDQTMGRVVFVDHRGREDAADEKADKLEAASKTNSHEVKMVVGTVKYLLQQKEYNPSNIVVLTPYVSQLLKLKDGLSSMFKVLVGDADFAEARKQFDGVKGFNVGGAESPETYKGDDGIRVATIDNYQGEESDIIIISLVRSNPENNIGFLKEPERVNVMLSRAKICEIIIGNSETLTQSRGGSLWQKILNHLKCCGSFLEGLPVQCQTHPEERQCLKTPEDFAKHCSDGGCTKICGNDLECGHKCTARCHGATGTCSTLCRVGVDTVCAGKIKHPLKMRCGGKLPKCEAAMEWSCRGKDGPHKNTSPCHIFDKGSAVKGSRKCGTCTRLATLERQYQEQEAEEKKSMAEIARDLAERRKKLELEKKKAERKRKDFEDQKSKEMDLRIKELELKHEQKMQELREEDSTEEIAEQEKQRKREFQKMFEEEQNKLHRLIANRTKQAEEQKASLEAQFAEDVATFGEKQHVVKEETEQARRENRDALAALRAANTAELEGLEVLKDQALKRLRDERAKEEAIVRAEAGEIQESIANLLTIGKELAKEEVECIVCFDDVSRIDGYKCSNPGGDAHFVCERCLVEHAKVQMDTSEGLGSIEARKGLVPCPGHECKSAGLSDEDICRYAPDAWTAYKAAKDAMLTKMVRENAIAGERKRAKEEQERLAKLSEDERRLIGNKTHIIDTILTLRCPRCKAAFDDFDGCFSLRCGNCPCSFCAMCLKDCGGDAHAHAAQCQEGHGMKAVGYYGTKESWEAIQKRRRERLVKEYIRTLPQNDRGRVVQRCEIELRDLGILQAVATDFPPRAPLPIAAPRGGGRRHGGGGRGPAAAVAAAGQAAGGGGAANILLDALAADEALARELQEQMFAEEEGLGQARVPGVQVGGGRRVLPRLPVPRAAGGGGPAGGGGDDDAVFARQLQEDEWGF